VITVPYSGNPEGDYFLNFYQETGHNIMYPKTAVGSYLYWLVGTANSLESAASNTFLDNMCPLRCEEDQLKFFATQLGVTKDSSWTDLQWRLYLATLWYNHETVEGIEYVLNGVLVLEEQQEVGTKITVTNGGNSFRISQAGEDLDIMSDQTTDNDLMLDLTGAIITIPEDVDPAPVCWLKQELNLPWTIPRCGT